jgi:hypothetical protein
MIGLAGIWSTVAKEDHYWICRVAFPGIWVEQVFYEEIVSGGGDGHLSYCCRVCMSAVALPA